MAGTLKDVTPTLKALGASIESLNESIAEVFHRLTVVQQNFFAALNATRATVDHRPSVAATVSVLPELIDTMGRQLERLTAPFPQPSTAMPASLPTYLAVVQKDCLDTLSVVVGQIKQSNKILAEAQAATDDALSRRSALDSKVSAYQRKGKPLSDSQTLATLQANATEADRLKVETMNQWLQSEQASMIALTTGLVQSFRCFTEHVGGITGVLSDAMERLFHSCPAPPPSQQGRRAVSRSRSPPVDYRNASSAATVGSTIYPRRASESSPTDRVILSPDVSTRLTIDHDDLPAYYRPRQRVSDTVSHRSPRVSSSLYPASSSELYR